MVFGKGGNLSLKLCASSHQIKIFFMVWLEELVMLLSFFSLLQVLPFPCAISLMKAEANGKEKITVLLYFFHSTFRFDGLIATVLLHHVDSVKELE